MMTGLELVTRAIEFGNPERLPFIQHIVPDLPDDVLESFELDRAKGGWFLDHPALDDWGCVWERAQSVIEKDLGQVVYSPLSDGWEAFDRYRPPDPRDNFYYERIPAVLHEAGDRYVMLSCIMTLHERHRFLRGFENALMDYYLEPEKTHRLLDMILEHRVEQFREIRKRFGGRVNGLFLSEDWGTQEAPFLDPAMFETFYADRYRILAQAAHEQDLHLILHSCGKVNDLVPYWIDAGIDALNLQQGRLYPYEEIGRIARGKIAFFAPADMQTSLPQGDPEAIREDVRSILTHWTTPEGGVVAFGMDKEVFGASVESSAIMLRAFHEYSGAGH